MIKSDTLRPGLLVSLKTSITGNVKYDKVVLEAEHVQEGVETARWETIRTVQDPVENEKAKTARSKASSAIRSVCSYSAFGLLCPEDKATKLEEAMVTARKIADDFNAESKLAKVSVYVITGRIASDDVEAVKAINSEVRELLDDMTEGLKNLDPKSVRAAASRTRELGQMLSPDAQVRVQLAITAAREAATKIVKAGEAAAVEVDLAAVKRINEQRTAFLDLDEAAPVAQPAAQARAIDMAPAEASN